MAKKVPKARRISRLKKKLDQAWSAAVRRRDKRCIALACIKTEALHAHHWYVRKARSLRLRWEIRNGVTLCYYHHMFCVHRDGDYWFMQLFFDACLRICKGQAFMIMEMGKPTWVPTEDELKERLIELNDLYKQT